MTTLIAIAEDETILANILKEKLESAGLQALIASDGQEALNILKKRPKPDLVLLDLIMPSKDGFAVLQEMAQDPELKTIPVIVISNLGEDDSIKKALSMGAVDYFVKAQHSISEIVEKIKSFLKKTGGAEKGIVKKAKGKRLSKREPIQKIGPRTVDLRNIKKQNQ